LSDSDDKCTQLVICVQMLCWPESKARSTSQRWNPVSDEPLAVLSNVSCIRLAEQCWRHLSRSLKNC